MARRTIRRKASPRSLKVSDGFTSYVLDQLEELGGVTPKSMFGGVGLYHRGAFFGIIARDSLYFKTAASNRPDYERARSKPFQPYLDNVVVDGNRSFGTMPELEALSSGDAVIRASRLDGELWEVRVDPL